MDETEWSARKTSSVGAVLGDRRTASQAATKASRFDCVMLIPIVLGEPTEGLVTDTDENKR